MSNSHHLENSVELPASVESAFDWHERPGAFDRLKPPWETIHVTSRKGTIRDGDRLAFRIQGLVNQDWEARHEGYIKHVQFQDRQEKGPFASWIHTHKFEPLGESRCRLTDDVTYELPMGQLGEIFGAGLVKSKLSAMFNYRNQVLAADLARHAPYAHLPKKKILVTGASGLIGSQLCAFLSTGGHQVSILTRTTSQEPLYPEILWDIKTRQIEKEKLEGFDAVVHLAGENIASGSWTLEVKDKIRDSRVRGTSFLCEALASLRSRPQVLISTSASGYYGNRGNEELTESSLPGDGFLPETCVAWESAAHLAVDARIRVVHPRFGIILSPAGGALRQMLTPFQLGAGGIIGNGKQYWSWMSIDDVLYAIHELIQEGGYCGPVNFSTPHCPTNAEFTEDLGTVLSRPVFIPVPAFALRMMFGEMADALLLASARMEPARLVEQKYRFEYPELKRALKHLLGVR